MESTIAAEANKPGVVIVDYIGLLSDEDGRRSRSRYEFVSGVASQLKVIARRQNIIIIAITQMHRKGEDAQPEPHLHDARDTGQIEASAGLLLGVWRDSENTRKMFCKVLKNTKGQCGLIVPLYFDGARMQIREWTDKDTLEER
jgi:replicative DNA helicase